MLKTKDIDLDIDQIENAKKMVAEKLEQFAAGEDVFDDEIGDDDLDKVSGGAVTLTFVIVQAVVVGVCTAAHEVHQVTRGRW